MHGANMKITDFYAYEDSIAVCILSKRHNMMMYTKRKNQNRFIIHLNIRWRCAGTFL